MKGTERGSEMKKTLAILLSLALIVCMMPSVAFGSATTEKIKYGDDNKDYTVSFVDEFDYNAKKQVPSTVTLTPTSGTAISVSSTDCKYFVGETEKEKPTEADTYTLKIKDGNEYKAVGTFKINPVYIDKSKLTLKLKEGKSLNSTTSSELARGDDATAKEYFELMYGTGTTATEISTNNYELACTVLDTETLSVAVSAKADGSFKESNCYYRFPIINSINDFTIAKANNSTDFMYTGKKQDPELRVYKTVGENTTELEKGKDYTVTCSGETEVGDWVDVTVKGIGSYEGQMGASFQITKFDLSKAEYSPTNIYVAKDATSIGVSFKAGGRTLVKGTDYSVKPEDPLNTSTEGTATMTITGKGNYEGEKQISYTVVAPNSTDLAKSSLTAEDVTYDGTGKTPKTTLTLGVNTITTNKYKLEYREYNSGADFSETKPINVGTYDIRVKPVDSTYEGTKEVEAAFKIKPLDVSSSSVVATYVGTVTKPVEVRFGSTVLVRGTDYDVDDYSASKTYYTITGKGNFTGTKKVYAALTSISSATLKESSGVYGASHLPKANVYAGSPSRLLYEGTDYTITYKNSNNQVVYSCREIGTYSVIITGIGSYTGTKTLYFTVYGNDISGYTVTLKNPSVTVTDYAQTPVIESVKKGTATLYSSDYTVSYQDAAGKTVYSMKDPGTYKVVLTGRNSYTGTTYAYFTINSLTQTVTAEKDSYKAYYNYSDPFAISAKASVATTLTYTSSNPDVASVSAYGIVTPKKVGRAVITVSAPATGKYGAASTTVVVKVYPKKGTMSRSLWTDGKKKQIKVRWYYQEGATKYQIRYSRKSNFSTYATKNAVPYGENKYTTNTATIKNLKSKTKYYVKVRAIYTDATTGEVYYGKWSTVKSITTK